MRCLATTQPDAFFNALLKIIIRNYFFKRKIGLSMPVEGKFL